MASYPTPARGYKLNIGFGLVNVGVKYAPIVREQRTKGKFLDPATRGPVVQQYVNEAGDVVKPISGYPYGDGFVVLDPEEVKSLESERDARLELKAFVELDTIDPLYIEKTHLIWPDKGSEASYDLLCEVLADTGRALVGTAVLNKSTKTIMLRYGQGCLLAHVCSYDANVAWSDHKLVVMGRSERPDPDPAMLDVARQLVTSLPDEFDLSSIEDEYDARLRETITAHAEGVIISRPEEPEMAPAGDLMEALKASVAAAKASTNGKEEAPAKRSRKKVA
jgi:DNA end-binding protein Ku